MTIQLREMFDKVKHSSDKWENYFGVYERHLRWTNFSSKPLKLVEVGVQRGGSLEMWKEYLGPWSKVIGIDVDSECAKLKYEQSNIEVVIGDQGDPKFWDDFLAKHPKIDIFIDDGGHFCDAQITTFEKVFPKMLVGGIYICEDVHTSYMPYNGGGYKKPDSFIEYAKSYIDIIHRDWIMDVDLELERKKVIGKDLTSVHFYDSIIVFEKLGKSEMKRVFPKGFE